MHIKFVPNDKPIVGKLADVELHFDDGPLQGLKLIGFSVWQADGRTRTSPCSVTFPGRYYAANGKRRTFALLRPIADADSRLRLRNQILDAYRDYESGNGQSA
jgi:hypothetical protein